MKHTRVLITVVLLILALASCSPSRKAAPGPAAIEWPTDGWRTGLPEEFGFDSLKLAEGLLAIRENGLDLHSIALVRRGVMLLDAVFYPYDGRALHDQASVTKSIMTVLIGIAAALRTLPDSNKATSRARNITIGW